MIGHTPEGSSLCLLTKSSGYRPTAVGDIVPAQLTGSSDIGAMGSLHGYGIVGRTLQESLTLKQTNWTNRTNKYEEDLPYLHWRCRIPFLHNKRPGRLT